MRKETKIIIVVVIVWVVILVGIAISRKGKKEETNNGGTQVQTQQTEGQTQQEEKEEYVQKLQDGSKVNISEQLRTERKLGELEIKNIQLVAVGEMTTLVADVENPTNKDVEEQKIKIEILNKNGEVITELRGKIDEVPAGGTAQINMAVTADVANAYDFKVSKR